MKSSGTKKARKNETQNRLSLTKSSSRSSSTDYSSSSFNLDNNSRGWLDNNVSSQEKTPMMRTSPQDILGTVSDEDILKLTQLSEKATAERSQPKIYHSVNRMDKDHEDSTRYRHQSHMQSNDRAESDLLRKDSTLFDSVTQENNSTQQMEVDSEALQSPEPSSSSAPGRQSLKNKIENENENENETLDPKRFHHEPFISKLKKKQREDGPSKYPVDIKDELNENRENKPIQATTATKENNNLTRGRSISFHKQRTNMRLSRRHSFDSIHLLMKQSVSKYDPRINHLAHHDLKPNEILDIKNANLSDNNIAEEESNEIYAFDYDSLPNDVKELLEFYRNEGKLELKELLVKNEENEDDEDDEDDEEDEEDGTINLSDIIKGSSISDEFLINKRRTIAFVQVNPEDKHEITSIENIDECKMDLHVSIMGDKLSNDENKDALKDLSTTVDIQLESLEQLKTRSNLFLDEYKEIVMNIESDDLSDRNIYYSKYGLENTLKEKESLDSLIDRLREEMNVFQTCLDETEKVVHIVQIDMDDTQNRMDTYIKDIPQEYYSELKRLEVKFDAILSKRAKNPWIYIGYTLLTYMAYSLLTVVLGIIYVLTEGSKVLLFPSNLWHSYRDYLAQRNYYVREQSELSISGRRNSLNASRHLGQPIIISSAAEMYGSTVSQRPQEMPE